MNRMFVVGWRATFWMTCVLTAAGCGRSAGPATSAWLGEWYSVPMNQLLELKTDSAVFGPSDKRVTQPLNVAGNGDGYAVITLLTNGQPTSQATLALEDSGQTLIVGGETPFAGRYRRTKPEGATASGGEMMKKSDSGDNAKRP